MGKQKGGNIMYAVQVKKGVYLTDNLKTTTDLQCCMVIDNYNVAKLYLIGQYERVVPVELKENKIVIKERL